MKKILLLTGVLLSLLSCSHKEDTFKNVTKPSSNCKDSIFSRQDIVASNGDFLTFEFKYDSLSHFYLSVQSDRSYQSVGMRYVNVIKDKDSKPIIKKCKLTNSAVEEYYIEFGISANYNNVDCLIIWLSGSRAWNISVSELATCKIEDYDGDGISEIIQMFTGSTKQPNEVYFFSDGNIIPYKFKKSWNKK